MQRRQIGRGQTGVGQVLQRQLQLQIFRHSRVSVRQQTRLTQRHGLGQVGEFVGLEGLWSERALVPAADVRGHRRGPRGRIAHVTRDDLEKEEEREAVRVTNDLDLGRREKAAEISQSPLNFLKATRTKSMRCDQKKKIGYESFSDFFLVM